MEMNVIRRVEIRGSAPGVAEATTQLQGLSKAQDQVAASGEKLGTVTDINTRRQISAAQAIDRLRASMDSTYRAQQQLERGQALVDRAFQQGAIDANRQAEMLGMLQQRYRQATAGSAGLHQANTLSSQQLGVMQFQLQDIMVGLASGQSPFTVMMQQGSQLAQSFRSGTGVTAALRAIGTGIVSFVTNPLNLAVVGFGLAAAAAVAFYRAVTQGGASVADTLKEHEEHIRRIKDAWQDAGKAMEAYGREGINVIETLDRLTTERMRQQLIKGASGITMPHGPLDAIFGNPLQPFAGAFGALDKSKAAGMPDILQFRRLVVEAMNAQGATQSTQRYGKSLLETTEELAKIQIELDGYHEKLNRATEAARVAATAQEHLKRVTEEAGEAAKKAADAQQAGHEAYQDALDRNIKKTEELRTETSKAFSSIVQDIRSGASAGQVLLNILNRIFDAATNKLGDMIANALFPSGGKGGGLGGLLGITPPPVPGQVNPAPFTGYDPTTGKVIGPTVVPDPMGRGYDPLSGRMRPLPTPPTPRVPLTKPPTGGAAPALDGSGGGTGGFFRTAGNYRGPVNDVLTNALRETALAQGYGVEAFSGRGGRASNPGSMHPRGLATDFRLIDLATGKPVGGVSNPIRHPEIFRAYEQFAQDTYQTLLKTNPAAAAQFRFGGYFSDRPLDVMHADMGGMLGKTMGGGTWAGGLSDAMRARYPGAESVGLGQLLSSLFGGLFGGGTGAMVAHAGGLIGEGDHMRPKRRVPLAMFANAPRYHSGGWLAADERPAILQTGERVLSRADVAQGRRRGGGFATTINVDARGSQIGETQIRGIVAGQLKEHRTDLTRHFGDVQRAHNLLKG
jgi:hypothetical protein